MLKKVMRMRIASLLNESSINMDERKRIMQRKGMNDAYKKNASYTQKNKTEMLEILSNLITGKTEKELFENDNVSLNKDLDNVQGDFIENYLSSTKSEVASDEGESFDLFSDEQFEFTIPERFMQGLNRNEDNNLIDGKDSKNVIFERKFKKAISVYTYQMQLAQNGYNINQPQYFLTA